MSVAVSWARTTDNLGAKQPMRKGGKPYPVGLDRLCPALAGPIGLTPVAELRAGTPRRPHRGAAAAATDECLGGSEVRLPCRHAVAFPCASERPARQLERAVSRPAHSAILQRVLPVQDDGA